VWGGLHQFVERFLVWQHLSNAKILPGNYTGRTNSDTILYVGAFDAVPKVNVPAGPVQSLFYDISTGGAGSTFTSMASIANEHIVRIYGPASRAFSILTPREAFEIDKKIDDGFPGNGKVFSTIRSSPVGTNCATSDDGSTAAYDLSQTTQLCVLGFRP
jgi:hypothetical protein